MLIPQKLFATPPRLLDYLCIKQITVLIWAVSALTLISSLKGFQYRIPAYVKKVMFSGEVMPVRQLRLWQEALPKAEFSNLYGLTEITCNCTYFRIEKVFAEDEKIPIGRPFAGRKDFQVKIMGRRIEREEVEYILNQIQGVDKSCCVVDQKRKILMAYYCGAADQRESVWYG